MAGSLRVTTTVTRCSTLYVHQMAPAHFSWSHPCGCHHKNSLICRLHVSVFVFKVEKAFDLSCLPQNNENVKWFRSEMKVLLSFPFLYQ